MALIKKLQNGLTIERNDLEELMKKYKLRGESAQKVRKQLGLLRDKTSATENPWTIDFDDVTNTYSVKGEGAESFSGNPKFIRTNFLSGRALIKDDADANSMAALIYRDLLEKNKSKETPLQGAQQNTQSTETLPQIGVWDWDEYTGRKDVSTNFTNALSEAKTDEERQQIFRDTAKGLLEDYIATAGLNKDKFNYKDVESSRQLLDLYNAGDWEKFNLGAGKFGLNYKGLNLTPEEKEAIKQGEVNTSLNNLQESLEIMRSNLSSLGINPDGWVSIDPDNQKLVGLVKHTNNWTPEGLGENSDWFTSLIKQHKANIFETDLGKHIILSGDKYFNYDITDPNHPGYGYSFRTDKSGFRVYTPEQTSQKFLKEFDYSKIPQGQLVQVNTRIPGYEGYTVYGDPTKKFDRLVLLKDGKWNSRIELARSPSGYLNRSTNTVVDMSPIVGIGNKRVNLTTISDKLGALQGYQPRNKRLNREDITSWKNNLKILVNRDVSKLSADELKNLVYYSGYLKNIATNPKISGTPISEQERNEIIELLEKSQEKIASRPDASKWLKTYKSGGVLKLQDGGKASEEYMKKYGLGKYKGTVKQDPTKPMYSDTVLGSSALDQIALGANAAALLPGVAGVVGAGTATVLEAARDFSDGVDWGDVGNLALNLGLTAASFVGLGGLRALVKGAKVADKAIDIAKLSKAASNTKAAKEVQTALKTIDTFADANKTTKTLGEIAKAGKDNKEVMEAVGVVGGFMDKMQKNKNLINIAVSSDKVIKGVDKLGEVAALGNVGYNLVANGESISNATQKITSGDFKNITLNEANSLASVLFGVKVGKHMARKAVAKRYGLEKVPVTDSKLKYTVKGKSVTAEAGDLDVKTKLGKVVNQKEIKKGIVDKYNQSIKDDKLKITEKDVKDISFSKATSEPGAVKTSLDLDQNWWLQKKGIKWANKYKMGNTPISDESTKSFFKTSKEGKKRPVNPNFTIKRPQNASEKMDALRQVKKYENLIKNWKYSSPETIKTLQGKIGTLKSTYKLKSGGILKLKEGKEIDLRYKPTFGAIPWNFTEGLDYSRNTIYPQKSPFEISVNWEKYARTPIRGFSTMLSPKVLHSTAADINHKPMLKEGDLKRFVDLSKTIDKSNTEIPEETGEGSMYRGISIPWNKIGKGLKTGYDALKGNTDFIDLTNISGFLGNEVANRQSEKHQLKALAESYYTTPKASRINLPAPTLQRFAGEKAGAKYLSQTNRLAKSTSDLDKSIGVSLSGADKYNEIIDRVNQIDSENINKTKLMQIQSNAETDRYNLGALAKDRALASEIKAGMQKVMANKALISGQNLMNLGKGLAANYQQKSQRKAWKSMYDFTRGDEYSKAKKDYESYLSPETLNKLKTEFEGLEGATRGQLKFEDWGKYKDFLANKESSEKRFKELNETLADLRFKALYSFKSGGKLSKDDRVEIENVKSRNKRILKETELLYKSIIEGNKALKDILIKVFK